MKQNHSTLTFAHVGHIEIGKTTLVESMLANRALESIILNIKHRESVNPTDHSIFLIPIIKSQGTRLEIRSFPKVPFIEPCTKKPWTVKTSEYKGKKGLGPENTTTRRFFRILEK